MRLLSFALTALLISAGCRSSSDPIESRSSVKGSVTVGGKAATGMVVRFHLQEGTADPRAPKLVEALTDAEGAFTVSQNRPDDGLAPGKYTVTFFWPPGGDTDAPVSTDQLKGRYLSPEKSKIQIEVKSSSNRLPAFELK